MTPILTSGDQSCPAGCGRTIPPSKYLCNIDADRQPGAMMVTYAALFDAGNTAGLAAAMAANLIKAPAAPKAGLASKGVGL